MPSEDFIVQRQHLREAKFVPGVVSDDIAPQAGQILLRVAKFALTSNNISYAAFGEMLGYWSFFPTDDPSWGRIPVWGFGDVVRSNHPEIAEGERIFGYFPMSTYLVIEAGDITPSTLSDMSEHRKDLHPWYNRYYRCSGDPMYDVAFEDLQPIFWPLFLTDFMLEDLFVSNDCFGAQTIILSSASSKTAFGLAHLLSHNAHVNADVVGLTSSGNVAFAEGLGCYDRVVAYDAIAELSSDSTAAFVDMAGNAEVRSAVHHRFADNLTYSCLVGGTHWESGGMGAEMPGPDPAFFFVPDYAEMRANEWGQSVLMERFATAWKAFRPIAADWISIQQDHGTEAVETAYRNALEGRVRPDHGLLLSLQ